MSETPLRRVFLPALLQRLANLIIEQGEEALRQSDVGLPPRATATFIHIAKHGPVSAADIAKTFEEPHQLVTQRIELLLEMGLIARTQDDKDARRKFLKLTPRGKTTALLVKDRLAEAEQIYAELFDEIGVDLTAAAAEGIAALERRPLIDRGRDHVHRTRNPTAKPPVSKQKRSR